jgi:hypothetical protein
VYESLISVSLAYNASAKIAPLVFCDFYICIETYADFMGQI